MKQPVQWLKGQVPQWVERGLITSDQGDSILKEYPAVDVASADRGRRILMALFGTIGVLLIGGGIILLLAYNWTDLSRPIRTVLSFLPLVSAQVIAGMALFRHPSSAAWREAAGLFWSLMVASSIALIAQTYHMPASFDTFLLTWAVLTLPIVYLLRPVSAVLVYMALSVSWAAALPGRGPNVMGFWLLMAALAPYIGDSLWRRRNEARTLIMLWGLGVTLYIGIGVSLQLWIPGMWLLIYSSFATLLLIIGLRWFDDADSLWKCPFQILGGLGVAVLAYVFTFRDVWDEVGFNHARYHGTHFMHSGWFDVGLLLVIIAAALVNGMGLFRKRNLADGIWLLFPILCVIMFAINGMYDAEMLPTLIMNGYVLMLGITSIVSGVSRSSLTRVNLGMLMTSGLIITRFFDLDLAILPRALLFIVIGTGFLVVNLVMLKRKKV